MRQSQVYGAFAFTLLSAASLSASEVVRYSYDALGRLRIADGRSTAATGHSASYGLDNAGNRTNYESAVVTRVAILPNSTSLAVDQSIVSNNLQYRLMLQADGNLVLYAGPNEPVWATSLFGPGMRLDMQYDGNLVLYQNNQPIWATHTEGHGGAHLAVQDDGNLTVFDGYGNLLWSRM